MPCVVGEVHLTLAQLRFPSRTATSSRGTFTFKIAPMLGALGTGFPKYSTKPVLSVVGRHLLHHVAVHGNKQTAGQLVELGMADRSTPLAAEGRALVVSDNDEVSVNLAGEGADRLIGLFP